MDKYMIQIRTDAETEGIDKKTFLHKVFQHCFSKWGGVEIL